MTFAWKIKRASFHRSSTLPKDEFLPIEKPLLQASCQVALLCAKKYMPHAGYEELVMSLQLEESTDDITFCSQ